MRRSYPGLLVMLLWFVSSAAAAVDRLPIEDFAREPAAARARLSPDGKRLAFLREYRERSTLFITDLDTNKTTRLDLGDEKLSSFGPEGIRKGVLTFQWLSNERLLLTTLWDLVNSVIAVDWDGRGSVTISGGIGAQLRIPGNNVIHSFQDKDCNILMLDLDRKGGGDPKHPDILRINTMTGTVSRELKNPGDVVNWGLDTNGVVRFGILSKDKQTGAIYRENEQTPWRTILPLQERKTGAMRPLRFDTALNRLLVTALSPEKRWAIYALNPESGELGEPLLNDPEYDIVPEAYLPGVEDVRLAGPVYSRKKQSLTGIRYYTEMPHIKWFDQEQADRQNSIDHALPGMVNVLVNTSQDEKRLLWFSYSDRNPGEYLLMDVEKKSLKLLATRMNWIKPASMAPMLGVKYTARDSLLIHGYLTLPVGRHPQGLPLVVMPHGGPWVRDLWEFNPLIQLLANRGYAVLQMNYRGSPGYGEDLFRGARREIGGKIQDDIEDATRWAVAAGVADPKRIAMMGSSYGGYSTLFALGHNPELYRCGISFAGVTDWPDLFSDRLDNATNKAAAKHWRREIGDPEKDKDFLAAISPVNFADKISAPVLLIQGKSDWIVPQDQAKQMIAALEKAGRKPASLFLADVGHNFGSEKKRLEIFQSIADFLEKNLGPGAP